MNIIKQGNHQFFKQYKAICPRCKAEILFNYNEITIISSSTKSFKDIILSKPRCICGVPNLTCTQL